MTSFESTESSSPIVTRAVAAGLRGEFCDNYEFAGWQKAVLTVLGALPQGVARFAIRRSSLSVYSISYPHSVQHSTVSGGAFLNHLKISIGYLLMSFNQGIDVYGELDMDKPHSCSAGHSDA